jgi:hypothetical protein
MIRIEEREEEEEEEEEVRSLQEISKNLEENLKP